VTGPTLQSAPLRTRYEIEQPPPPALTVRRIAPLWPLALILVATCAAYAGSLRSPLYADDYIYLVAARDWSFGEYARVAFTPWGDEPTFTFTRNYWRPLAFIWFEIAEPVFGGEPLPYHVVNLGIHIASTVLVWLLASRLDARPAVRAVATAAFALYPGSFEAVTWISSVNSAGLTFALTAWLMFLRATKGEQFRWSPAVASACLLAAGLMFRETATALLPAMGLWYVTVQRRERLRDWRTYLPFVPFVAVGAVYALIRTRLLTEPLANPEIYRFDSETPDRWWFYVKHALLPFRDGADGWRETAQAVAGVLLLATPVVALLGRRWSILALSSGLLLSIVPQGATVLGVGLRYFYFSTPVLGLLLGVAAADLGALASRSAASPRARAAAWAGGAALGVLVVAGALVTKLRIDDWETGGPDQHQGWVDGLRAEYPELPAAGTLYCANVPIFLAIFDAVMLEPTVRWYYPEIGDVVHHTQSGPPPLGPGDRFYAAPIPGVTLAQP